VISKEALVDGGYYRGTCRNAEVARWDAASDVFWYWRQKYGHTYLEAIKYPTDDAVFDVFVVEERVDTPEIMIPLEGR
jgi:hypothetical protein